MRRRPMILSVALTFAGFVAGIATVVSCSPGGGGEGSLVTVTVGDSSTSVSETSATAGEATDCTTWEVDDFSKPDGNAVTLPSGWEPFAILATPEPIFARRCVD